MRKKALIYGILGQDGHYLAKLLSGKGYEIAGVARPGSAMQQEGAGIYFADLAGKKGDYLRPIAEFSPDEIYNLAGMHHQYITQKNTSLAFRVNAKAPENMLACLYETESSARFFQASSAYIFGAVTGRVDENTPPKPIGSYAQSKAEAQRSVLRYRNLGVFAASGILFNHESALRSEDFVTRKISAYAAREKLGMNCGRSLVLGNLGAKRDWGFAGDYVEAMWLMLQQKQPGDYVVATGESHSVEEFCKEAFSHVGLDWEKYVKVDGALFRTEEQHLEPDTSKIRRKLGWRPKVKFKELVHLMVDADISALKGSAIGGRK